MHIAIVTLEGFNELDSLIAYGMLSRIALLGDASWQVSIASPQPRVRSMNGLVLDAHADLSVLPSADAVLVGSGIHTRQWAQDPALKAQLQLDPERQLIGAQCSGTLLLAQLGYLHHAPVSTDLTTRPWVQESGVQVSDQPFMVHGNVATAGGCLASQYLAAWVITRLRGAAAAREVLYYFAPVGEKDIYVERAWSHIASHVSSGASTGPISTLV